MVAGIAAVALLSVGACETTGTGGGVSAGADGGGTAGPVVATVSASDAALGPATLPVYSVGDMYVFDTPRETWTITEVTDDTVSWDSDLGGTRQTTFDPLLPSLRSAAPEIGAVTRIITDKQGELWPLVVGNESAFVVAAGMDQPPYSQSLAWSCRVVGTNLVTVQAGRFNTFKIACARSDGLRLNTYYAPDVGYFVRREVSTADNQGQARSLVAYRNGTGDRLVAGSTPDAAAMNPLDTDVSAPVAAAEVSSLEPLDGPPAGGAAPSAPAGEGVGAMPQPLVTAPAPDASASGAPAASGPAPVASAAPVSAPVSTPAVSGGAWTGTGVRLASFRTEASAMNGWSKLQAAYPGLLGSLAPRVEQVTLDGRGTFHRLYAGPFPSPSAARGLCGKIAEMGQTCEVQTFN